MRIEYKTPFKAGKWAEGLYDYPSKSQAMQAVRWMQQGGYMARIKEEQRT